MKITDLTENLLIHLDVRDRLTPLREINYRDVRVGDIFVKSPYLYGSGGFQSIAILITGKYLKGSRRLGGRREELLQYDVYHIKDGEVVLDVEGHKFSYKELVKERWKRLKPAPSTIVALNYPREILNSRKDN
tara:strand:+ start:84 stop:482 length:399 start_codon:yes stop_codon:yes gene_type:complete